VRGQEGGAVCVYVCVCGSYLRLGLGWVGLVEACRSILLVVYHLPLLLMLMLLLLLLEGCVVKAIKGKSGRQGEVVKARPLPSDGVEVMSGRGPPSRGPTI
jgi:hypothetical protein